MPTIEEVTEQIKEAHYPRGSVTFSDTHKGGAVNHRYMGSTGNRYSRFSIHNWASYGSRTTTGNERGNATNYLQLRVGNGDQQRIPLISSVKVTNARTPPSTSYFRSLTRHNFTDVVQYTGKAMWILFDIKKARDPGETLLWLYKMMYGDLENSPRDFPVTEAEWIARQTNFLHPDENRGEGFTESTVSTARRRRRSRPARLPGEGTDWKRTNPEIKEVENDPETALNYYSNAVIERNKTKLSSLENQLEDSESDYRLCLERLYKLRETKEQMEDQIFGLRQAISKRENTTEDQEKVEELKLILQNFYDAVWVEDDKVLGLTKPIICEQDGVMRANIGRFLVFVKDGAVDYRRADGRTVKGTNFGGYRQCHAPHHNGTICWGEYRTQVGDMEAAGEIGQLFLLTYHHLTSVTNGDAYIYLPDYVQKLHIKMKIDLVAGETDWPEVEDETPKITLKPKKEINEISITLTDIDIDLEAEIQSQIRALSNQGLEQLRTDMGELVTVEEDPDTDTPAQPTESPTDEERPGAQWVTEGSPLTPEDLALLGVTADELIAMNPENELEQTEDI